MPEPIVVVDEVKAPSVVPPATEPVAKPEVTPEVKPTETEATVPISRFKEVYDKRKELEAELAKYKTTPTPTTPVAPAEDEEERRAKDFVLNTIKQSAQAEQAEVQAEQNRLDERIGFYKSIDANLDEKVLLDFITKYDLDYTTDPQGREIHPFDKAYKIWTDMSAREKTVATRVAEESAKKPNTPSTPRPPGSSDAPANGKKQTMSQLADEAKRNLPAS